jgi:RHS repeat-associated protein
MYYEVVEPIGGNVQSTTYYYYNGCGNVTRAVTNQQGAAAYAATKLVYAANGSAVAYVAGETWDGTDAEATYNITYAREFRYDGARARYLVRALAPAGLLAVPPQFNPLPGGDTWSDYDGDRIYGDFTADAAAQSISETRSFEPGIGTFRWLNDAPWAPSVQYYHADLIGSTRLMSHAVGALSPGSQAEYTAFGELIPGSASHRYGYAGAYGYQTDADAADGPGAFPFIHVGARYYDPATGRFLQRDPIGIRGGYNVYAYVRNSPAIFVDPSGFMPGGAHNPNIPGDGPFTMPRPPGDGYDPTGGAGFFGDGDGKEAGRKLAVYAACALFGPGAGGAGPLLIPGLAAVKDLINEAFGG